MWKVSLAEKYLVNPMKDGSTISVLLWNMEDVSDFKKIEHI
jgi:hypothetical protein